MKATVSADGLGMWVATSNYVRYVPFGNNALTPTTATTNWLSRPHGRRHSGPTRTATARRPLLRRRGGLAAQRHRRTSTARCRSTAAGLPNVGGQTGTIYRASRRPGMRSGNFPTSNQIAISPDGNTIFVADSRTDGNGGILGSSRARPGSWTELGNAQVGTGSDSGLRAPDRRLQRCQQRVGARDVVRDDDGDQRQPHRQDHRRHALRTPRSRPRPSPPWKRPPPTRRSAASPWPRPPPARTASTTTLTVTGSPGGPTRAASPSARP